MHQIDDLHENKLISDPYNLLNNDFQLDTIDPSKIAINRERMPELNINHSHFTINRKGRGSSSFGRYSRNNLSTSRQNASVVNLNHKLISPRIRNLIWIDQSTPRVGINRREVLKNLKKINSKLDPRFKLSKIDIEEIKNFKYVREWNKPIDNDLLIKSKKQIRRKEYWNQRVLPADSGIYYSASNI